MQKEKSKNRINHVGADSISAQNKNGITLIALIITIIVMLILVAVTVSVALKGELLSTAKRAAKGTETEKEKEIASSEGRVEVDGVWYETMEDYLNNNPLIEWKETTKPEGWDNDKVLAMTEGKNIIPLPEGFRISEKREEKTVNEGLVITDGTNEFVWIPVEDTYTEGSLGPLTDTDYNSGKQVDSQETLDYYYGEGFFDYNKDFKYEEDKTKIETSINKYKGFYVGRYETTIDENGSIGSKANTPVLTAGHTIKEGTNPNYNNEPFYYRWYGLYKVQKDMYAGSEAVFSTMITSNEWDKIISFTGYGSARRGTDTYTTKPDLSGAAYKNTNPAQYDVSKNIYDLAGNVCEWTLTPLASIARVSCAR